MGPKAERNGHNQEEVKKFAGKAQEFLMRYHAYRPFKDDTLEVSSFQGGVLVAVSAVSPSGRELSSVKGQRQDLPVLVMQAMKSVHRPGHNTHEVVEETSVDVIRVESSPNGKEREATVEFSSSQYSWTSTVRQLVTETDSHGNDALSQALVDGYNYSHALSRNGIK